MKNQKIQSGNKIPLLSSINNVVGFIERIK